MTQRISYNKLFRTLFIYLLISGFLPSFIRIVTENRDMIIFLTTAISFLPIYMAMGKDMFLAELKEKREPVTPLMLLILLLATFGATVLGSFTNLAVQQLLGLVGIQTLDVNAQIGQMVALTPSLFLLFNLVILAPVVEELVMRNFLYRGIEEPNPWLGVFVSGVLFALMHGNLNQSISVVYMGIYFSYLAMRYSMWVPVVAHIVNNGVFYALNSLVARDVPLLPYLAGSVSFFGLIAFILVVIDAKKKYRRTETTQEKTPAVYLKSPWFWAFVVILLLRIFLFDFVMMKLAQ